jgi:UDP-N-acetylmuramate dehydrogenase
MRVGGTAKLLAIVNKKNQIPRIIAFAREKNLSVFVLGSGSNTIFSSSGYNGLIIKMQIPGITILEEDDHTVLIRVGGGVIWDYLVEEAVKNGWWGIENMSMIPGTVGATPVQNVSANGQEIRSVLESLEAFDITEGKFIELDRDSCSFGFRKSIFNTSQSGRYIIAYVNLRLRKNGVANTKRKNVARALSQHRKLNVSTHNISRSYSLPEIREVICLLRSNGKNLPIPNTLGNVGTFFQACLIPPRKIIFTILKALRHGDLDLALRLLIFSIKQSSSNGTIVSSKYLIEKCGLADLSSEGISLYRNNCVVMVNVKDGTNTLHILKVMNTVRTQVYKKLGLIIPVEPVFVGFNKAELTEAFSLDN